MFLEPKEKEKKYKEFGKTLTDIEEKLVENKHLEAVRLYLRLKTLSEELKKFGNIHGIVFLENEVKGVYEKLKEANAFHSLKVRFDPSRIFPFAALFILIVLGALFFRYGGITGFVAVHEERSYADQLGLEFSANSSYNWFLGNAGDLKSVKLSGSLSSNATAKVYLKKGNQLKLVFDSEQASGLTSVTGAVAGGQGKGQAKGLNKTNETDDNETTDDGTNQADETNQTASPANETINETDQSTANETNESIQLSLPAAQRNISIELEYNSGTLFNPDDDGVESTAGAIDFTVANSDFNFDADETKLCTKWVTYNLDSYESTTVCYGNSDCCSFVGVLPSASSWNDFFVSTFGRYNAGLENLISAQIVFYNVSLEPENIYADIVISNLSSLDANYYHAYGYFNDECVETCSGLSGYNEIFYELVVEVENGVLKLDNISYNILEEIKEVNINLNVEDSSGSISAVLDIYSSNGSLVEGNKVEPGLYTIEVVPGNKVIEKVRFEGVNITKTLAGNIGIDNVSDSSKANITDVNVSKVFALDPSKLNFSSATLTGIASASALYKCKEWVFSGEECAGSWVKIADLVVGEEYNATITPDDPGFAEGDPTGNISENATEELNVTFDVAIKDASGSEINSTLQFIDPLTDILEEESKDKKRHNLKIRKDNYKIKINLKDMPVDEIEVDDVNISSNITEFINIDDVPNNITGPYNWTEVFAVDASKINFSSAVIRRNATGTAL
ncbi:hypothetical protein J4209_04850, partial [Candidatus Woesearchaeota archaeon]|nr:hypothetical protein [Candidatus Woesearchaeota archaeon]